jgi:hypothetical protein
MNVCGASSTGNAPQYISDPCHIKCRKQSVHVCDLVCSKAGYDREELMINQSIQNDRGTKRSFPGCFWNTSCGMLEFKLAWGCLREHSSTAEGHPSAWPHLFSRVLPCMLSILGMKQCSRSFNMASPGGRAIPSTRAQGRPHINAHCFCCFATWYNISWSRSFNDVSTLLCCLGGHS